MREVYVSGIGCTKVKEMWETPLRSLAVEAIRKAMQDAQIDSAEALYVGNMLSGELCSQEHLGALVSDFAALDGIEAFKVEAACASGAAALRCGFLAVASGLVDNAIVCGVEQMTDVLGERVTYAHSLASDGDYEGANGLTFVALNALLMRRYMHEFSYEREDLAEFAVNAHRNAAGNEFAMFRREISLENLLKSSMVADPITILDCSPVCDGAAALILSSQRKASPHPLIKITGSGVATDTISLHDRANPLFFKACYESSKKAYEMAKRKPEDIGLFELHDAFTIISALSLEACGFAEMGKGAELAKEKEIALDGKIPITTMGGCKARGNPLGATGVYQILEVVKQLRGEALKNQVETEIGMAQNIGGVGATAVTHILEV